MDQLKELCARINFQPKHCMEFGAAHPATSQLREFIKDGVICTLIEANPRLFYCLKHGYDDGDFQGIWPNVPLAPHKHPGFGKLNHVFLYNVAVSDKSGIAKFYECNASSFLQDANSPAKVNDKYVENDKDAYTVQTLTSDILDDGSVDLLAADVEGCEWFVLKNLVSRPKIICLETHSMGGYVNPDMAKINAWMIINDYKIMGSTESDTLYLKD